MNLSVLLWRPGIVRAPWGAYSLGRLAGRAGTVVP